MRVFFIILAFVATLLLLLIRFLNRVLFTPIYIQHVMRSQGIKGPSYKFLHGNTKEIYSMKIQANITPAELSDHRIYPRIYPEIHSWTKLYGKNFLFWNGTIPTLVVTEPEMIKEALSKDGTFVRQKQKGFITKLLKDSILVAQGLKWNKLRSVANHAYNGIRLKDMVPAMIASTGDMLERWSHQEGREIEVYGETRILASQNVARTTFGNNYLEGKAVFDKMDMMMMSFARKLSKVSFPGASLISFKSEEDMKAEKLPETIRASILAIVKKREEEMMNGKEETVERFGNDFLGSLLQASHDGDKSKKISVEDVIDNCITLYLVGIETVNSSLTWAIFLLATHQEWQEKARNEVLEIFGQQVPNAEGISRLKIISMIINETLRLYPSAVNQTRIVERKSRLGNIMVPANVELLIPNVALHHDTKVWGEDAHLFKPDRFAQGVAKATNDNPISFFPFGSGPRICVGMNFAYNEMKIAISMILQRYKVTLSPTYVHAPIMTMTPMPRQGMPIVLQKL